MKIKARMMFAHMRAAFAYGATSYARRLQVGCVIVDPISDQPVAIGWNGTAPGAPNVCEREENGELVSVGVIHAEHNAINRIPWRWPGAGLTMFVTHSPCPDCTKLIIESGMIDAVVYSVPYRITEGITEMMNAGIDVYRMVDDHAVVKHLIRADGELGYAQIMVNPDLKKEK